MGTQLPLPQRGRSPQFSAHICCGQMAGWIKMALGMKIGLSPSDFMLDGDPAPPQKGCGAPQFSPYVYCGQTAAWIKIRCHLVRRRHCVRWGPSSPSPKRGQSPLPNYWPMSVVAKQLDRSRWHLALRWALDEDATLGFCVCSVSANDY